MRRSPLRMLPLIALFVLLPVGSPAQAQTTAHAATVAEVRQAIRRYDAALRRGDAAAAGRFWAPEYTFINPRGEVLGRADRIANLREGRTAFDSLAQVPQEERIRTYGNVAVYTTLLTIGGRYSGKAHQGSYRALVVWVRRNGQWQQTASQLTPVVAP
jgi:ketosteroid isomerase-like protein